MIRFCNSQQGFAQMQAKMIQTCMRVFHPFAIEQNFLKQMRLAHVVVKLIKAWCRQIIAGMVQGNAYSRTFRFLRYSDTFKMF